jgi:hypothetical protein
MAECKACLNSDILDSNDFVRKTAPKKEWRTYSVIHSTLICTLICSFLWLVLGTWVCFSSVLDNYRSQVPPAWCCPALCGERTSPNPSAQRLRWEPGSSVPGLLSSSAPLPSHWSLSAPSFERSSARKITKEFPPNVRKADLKEVKCDHSRPLP